MARCVEGGGCLPRLCLRAVSVCERFAADVVHYAASLGVSGHRGCGQIPGWQVLDDAVCRFFLRRVMTEMHKSASCYAGSTNMGELHYRPVACSCLRAWLQEEESSCLVSTSTGMLLRTSSKLSLMLTNDQVSDFMSDLSGWSFCDGTFTHEDGENLKPHEAVDVRGYVIDLSLPNHPRLPRSLFEMKGFTDWSVVIYQALYYGCAAAIENLSVGRYKKIHVVVMGIPWIGVAEIDPIGWLMVEPQNKFTLEGVAIFKTHVAEKCRYLERKGKTTESNALQDKYLSKTDAVLLDDIEKQMTSRISGAAVLLNARAPVGTVYSPVFDQRARILAGTATYRRRVWIKDRRLERMTRLLCQG